MDIQFVGGKELGGEMGHRTAERKAGNLGRGDDRFTIQGALREKNMNLVQHRRVKFESLKSDLGIIINQ